MGTYFTDSRDGQKYRVERFEEGFVWMAENLNYKISNSWCYNDDESNGSKYGRLYTWDAAKAACPAGWELPNRRDLMPWLLVVAQGISLKAKSGWAKNGNGTDDDGFLFSALPGGRRFPAPPAYLNVTYEGAWWTKEEYDSDYAYSYGMECDRNDMYINHDNLKDNGFSVRCVLKDKFRIAQIFSY